ncbi:hypothetical protein [Pseudorhodoferax aquiterrae]|nr:hypothetical protein [Pseudorhodoferax aquiterrae]
MKPAGMGGLCGLVLLLAASAQAQTTDSTPACPAPHEMRALHLYGTWQAQWQGEDAPGATLQLERHPELGDSVRGRVERDGTTALLAGDVDDGDLTLEESRDGKRISATWIGRVDADSCGKLIRGTWTDADTEARREFVLRRAAGW